MFVGHDLSCYRIKILGRFRKKNAYFRILSGLTSEEGTALLKGEAKEDKPYFPPEVPNSQNDF